MSGNAMMTPQEIRTALGWSQHKMAEHLECNQSTVCRMEAKGRASRLFKEGYRKLSERIARLQRRAA